MLISSHVKILVIRVENNSSWDQAGPVEEQLQQHPRVRIGVLREAHDTRLDTGSKTVTESRRFVRITRELLCPEYRDRRSRRERPTGSVLLAIVWILTGVRISTSSSNNL